MKVRELFFYSLPFTNNALWKFAGKLSIFQLFRDINFPFFASFSMSFSKSTFLCVCNDYGNEGKTKRIHFSCITMEKKSFSFNIIEINSTSMIWKKIPLNYHHPQNKKAFFFEFSRTHLFPSHLRTLSLKYRMTIRWLYTFRT
jgi:hypothetical protein